MFDLQGNNVVYVTRDIERALGVPTDTPSFYIISNATEFAKIASFDAKNVSLIESEILLDTWQLLEHDETKQFLENIDNPNIVVFKNTPKIERICREHNWNLLNPSAELANTIEEKISQVEWLGDLTSYLPEHKIQILKEVAWNDEVFILQFNRAHTGSGTVLIDSKQKLEALQQQFPERPVRITSYIKGPVFTSNNVVGKDKDLMGNISYQITGLTPFTTLPFATVGNDFGVVSKLLSEKHQDTLANMVFAISEKLKASGWKGLFGVDVVLDTKNDKLYLIEINARQPASTSFESWRQGEDTMMQAHLMALLDQSLKDFFVMNVGSGGQIVMRVGDQLSAVSCQVVDALRECELKVIQYDNTKSESDLLRIQSTENLMSGHGILNETGKKIVEILQN